MARHGWLSRLAVVVIAVGALIRIEQFLSRRSLWLDEALLANNIVERSFGRLLDPLSGDQGAPVLFLWLERAAVVIGGNNEYALRAVPLAAGIALLPAVYALGRRLRSPVTGLVAVTLTALSPALIRYSTEVKQYIVDAALVTVIMVLAAASLDRRRALVPLAVVGVVAVWLSHPAALTLAGVGPVLLVTAMQRRDTRAVRALVLTGAAWVMSIGVVYLVSLRDLRDNDVLEAYWRPGFPPRPATVDGVARWLWHAGESFLSDPGHFFASGVVVALMAVGSVRIARTEDGLAKLAIVLAPLVVTIGAALAHAYPFRGRLVMFVVPIVLVLVASAVEGGRAGLVALAALLVVTGPWWPNAARVIKTPPELVESRPVLQNVAEQLLTGDVVIVHDVAIGPASYYAPLLRLLIDARTVWLNGIDCGAPPPPYLPLDTIAGKRAWLVFAYTLDARPDDEVDIVRDEMDRLGPRLATFEKEDASATLYGLDPAPSAPADPSELGCLVVEPISPAGSRRR
jgi:hypothetical protein